MKIEWLENTGRREHLDVYIVAEKKGENTTGTRIVFCNGAQHKVTKAEQLLVGFAGDRLYFDEATPRSGYKLRGYGTNSGSRYVRIRKAIPDFYGEHRLIFDADQKLWYVNKRG